MIQTVLILFSAIAFADPFSDGQIEFQRIKGDYNVAVAPIKAAAKADVDALNQQWNNKKAEKERCTTFECAAAVKEEMKVIDQKILERRRKEAADIAIVEDSYDYLVKNLMVRVALAHYRLELRNDPLVSQINDKGDGDCPESYGRLSTKAKHMVCKTLNVDFKYGGSGAFMRRSMGVGVLLHFRDEAGNFQAKKPSDLNDGDVFFRDPTTYLASMKSLDVANGHCYSMSGSLSRYWFGQTTHPATCAFVSETIW